jgi:transposase
MGALGSGAASISIPAGSRNPIYAPKPVATVARNLGLSEQTLHNWVKAASNGGLKSSATPAVSAEQMEISRLRTELSRVKMERDILKKAAAYFAREYL